MSIKLINEIQRDYFENKSLPSIIGGNQSSVLFQLLTAIHSVANRELDSVKILSNWLGADVTWYTKFLREFLPIPYFKEDTDRVYLERVLYIQNLKFNEPELSDLEKLARAVTYFINSFQIGSFTLLDSALSYSSGSGLFEWSDNNDLGGVDWHSSNQVNPPDPTLWGGADLPFETLDTIIISIDEDVDPEWKSYWELPENYTKILKILPFFIPPHLFYQFTIKF